MYVKIYKNVMESNEYLNFVKEMCIKADKIMKKYFYLIYLYIELGAGKGNLKIPNKYVDDWIYKEKINDTTRL